MHSWENTVRGPALIEVTTYRHSLTEVNIGIKYIEERDYLYERDMFEEDEFTDEEYNNLFVDVYDYWDVTYKKPPRATVNGYGEVEVIEQLYKI